MKPLNESLNWLDLIVGKNELRLSLLSNCLDLFKAYGVKKIENIKYNNTIIIETKKNKFTTCIFLTPATHKTSSSLLFICLKIKIISDNRKASGINLGARPKDLKMNI